MQIYLLVKGENKFSNNAYGERPYFWRLRKGTETGHFIIHTLRCLELLGLLVQSFFDFKYQMNLNMN